VVIGILYNEALKEYDFGPGHPFRGERYELFYRFLRESVPEDDNYRILEAEAATDDDLALICSEDYIKFTAEYYHASHLRLDVPSGFSKYQSMDNHPVGRPGELEEAARLVVGQAKKACDLVNAGTFAKVASVGGGLHHAKRSYGEGFCIYNDVAFSGLYLVQHYGLERVLILDTDAHAGNGTVEYFYKDPRVLFIDLHQDPKTIYPSTGFAGQIGAEKGTGFTINVPLPEGADERCYKLVFDSIVLPVAREFKPQIIIRNGGSDPHFYDGLTNLGLSIKGFRMIGEMVREMAELCGGKEVDLIASGYNRNVLPRAWLALLAGLAGIEIEIKEPESASYVSELTYRNTEKVIEEVKVYLGNYWQCLR
jgi:acetoin utilization protein AcuC